MIILEMAQGSPEWVKEKLGKPSASNASKIITNGGEPSKSRTNYMYELAAEIMTGRPTDGFCGVHMQNGKDREDECRKLYEMLYDVSILTPGVIYKDEERKVLCSPDGINGTIHGLEMKNVMPKTQVKYLLDNKVPDEYFSQIQFSLWVTGFEYWDFFSYAPGMKPLRIREYRDEEFIEALEREVRIFCAELETVVSRINSNEEGEMEENGQEQQKKKRGRPFGSKNKPKPVETKEEATA